MSIQRLSLIFSLRNPKLKNPTKIEENSTRKFDYYYYY